MPSFESSTVHQAPRFSEQEAIRLAEDRFGLRVRARPLPSERDQNFHLTAESGEQFVLKIANPAESREILEIQNRAMEQVVSGFGRPQLLVGSLGEPCPRVRAAINGESIIIAEGRKGSRHFVRLLNYLPGVPLARVKPHDPGLLKSLGTFFGALDRSLEGFDDPATHRDFYWDLKNAVRVVNEFIDRISKKQNRDLVARFLSLFEERVAPVLPELRRGVIHNDGNDYNVLVRRLGRWEHRVSAVVDFGDMTHSLIVGEVAIASAYAMMGKADPLAAATRVLSGYHTVNPLSEAEVAVLFPMIGVRLIMSVCISAEQRSRRPADEYLSISEKPAWELLRLLETIHPDLAHYTFRQACGLEPSPRSEMIVGWLRKHAGRLGPVVNADLTGPEKIVFDLSVGSPGADAMSPTDASQAVDSLDPEASRSWVFQRMREAGAKVGIGRYDEPRRCYTAAQFALETDELPETRTLHLGIDLFQDAGSPVFAPLEGSVHSFQENDLPLDYGPTIILEHEIGQAGGGTRFYTLYGHLSRESLKGLRIGAPVKRGQQIGTMGHSSINGGWPPHLHFQIITDLFGERGNYPGVAAPSRRDVWLSVCPDPNVLLGIPEADLRPIKRSKSEILGMRRRYLGKSLSISYRKPLEIVRGSMQYLYDEMGRAYLDGVNNVCHVGHCHPRVVRAGQEQMAVLNTNTRYLHGHLVEYAKRLCDLMPDPLSVCFLVCSGSEANELAVRLARTHTGRRDIICVEGGYHGNTQNLVDISSYKFDGPGGTGAPAHVHKVPMPDGYRGRHRGTGAETGAQYAQHIREVSGRSRVAAFICEPVLGCGGQIVPPEGYLREAYAHVRASGGVCIADEVQVGFGRLGSHSWGFETQGVVPDIVTLGKPIGNGHPLAAVITTRAIADSFATGMEYFNTFGGNPVSCAIGMAVLDVIRDEKLQENARRVGGTLRNGFQRLMERHLLIGDVRGMGLFLGVELVLDRETLEPAPEHAAYVIERMKDHGILLSTDGPLRNVIKIKPPLVFTQENADYLVGTLDKVLGESCLQAGTG